MTKFILSTVTGKEVLTTFIFLVNIIRAYQISNDRLPAAAVSRLIEDYVRPFVRKFQIDTRDTGPVESIDDSAIEKAIEQKIKELQPRLDESTFADTRDNNPPDMDDTKILEYTDKERKIIVDNGNPQPLKGHINKYKKLRRKIEKRLKTEEVSDKTNALVTETLDQMISQMLGSQCRWNRAGENKMSRSNSPQNDKDSMIKSWKSKWAKLIKRYSAASKSPDADGLQYKEMLLFLIKLREFFFEIHDELNTQNDRYKVKCQLVDEVKASLPKKFSVVNNRDILRERPIKLIDTNDNCKYIRICSEELKSFLMDFYINLKETVDVAFKNYEEMYKRDINTADSSEKRTFVAILKDINGEVNKRVGKLFKKQTEELKLDVHNNTQAKVDAIKTFLKSNVELIQNTIGKLLRIQLKSLDSKLRFTVKQDLTTTLGIELSNLNKDFSDKICLVFQTCNGKASRRGMNMEGARRNVNVDPNEIYVNLHLGFNDQIFRRSGSVIRSLSDETKDRGYNRYLQPSTIKSKFDLRRYMNVSVTRTTYRVPVKKRTRKTTFKRTQCTTKSTRNSPTESTTKRTKATTSTTKKVTANTTKSNTLPSETTTIEPSSSTYTYGDYVRRMIAAGKIKLPTTKRALTSKRYETTSKRGVLNRIIGSLLY